MDNDLVAGTIGGILEGIGQGAKDFYNIQQSRALLELKQKELDNDTAYKHAQVDYLEGRGNLAGQQADAYRFLINRADKAGQTKIDAATDTIDDTHANIIQKQGSYRQMLNQALQTPEGQDYIASATSGASEATGMPTESMGPAPNMTGTGSNIVNTVMPGVGTNQANLKTSIPTTSYGLGTQLNKAAGFTGNENKRNTSLQKAMGAIDAMGIDNREDAQFAMEKYYGADWSNNPEAVSFMDQKFGKSQPAGSPQAGQPIPTNIQTSEGAIVPAQGAGASPPGAPVAAGDFVAITGPDGNNYKVPRANLQKALQRGYRVRNQ